MAIETGDDCPLCAEAFDLTDKRFIPCLCGFQICLWCYRKIQESDSPRCPKCRRQYTGEFRLKPLPEPGLAPFVLQSDRDNTKISHSRETTSSNPSLCTPIASLDSIPSSPSSLHEQTKHQVISRDSSSDESSFASLSSSINPNDDNKTGITIPAVDRQSSTPSGPLAKDLRDVRVIRRDLCYVVGLPLEVVVDENGLKSFDFFGKYGKVVNIIVNRNPNFKAPDKKKSCALYVTFASPEDAKEAIMDLDESFFEGRRLKASYGTTKYCSNFLRKAKCQNRQCFYLHEKGADEDSFTVAEMNQVKETSRGLTCSALLASEFEQADWKDSTSLFGKNRRETVEYFTLNPKGRMRTPFKSIAAEIITRRRDIQTPSTESTAGHKEAVGELPQPFASSPMRTKQLGTTYADVRGRQSADLTDLDALVLASVNGGVIQQAYELYRHSQHQKPAVTTGTRQMYGSPNYSLLVIPPPPPKPADPQVHPSLGWRSRTARKITDYQQLNETYLESLLPSSLLDFIDSPVLTHHEKLPPIQPGRFVPAAPSTRMSSYVTPADQVALQSKSPYSYRPVIPPIHRQPKSEVGPPGFENYTTPYAGIAPPDSIIPDSNQIHFAAAGYYSPLLVSSDYHQPLRQVMSLI